MRILRFDNVTPLEEYIGRWGASPHDLGCLADLAHVLVLREREYVALHVRVVGGGVVETAPIDAWGAYPLTPRGRLGLEQDLAMVSVRENARAPRDLFGVKSRVTDTLWKAAHAQPEHDTLPALLLRFLIDLLRFEEAVELACGWSAGSPRLPLILAFGHQAALMLPPSVAASRADEIELRAAHHVPDFLSWSWSSSIIQEEERQVLDRAHEVRARCEPGFSRFLTTEGRFYRAEREEALRDFEDAAVPQGLAHLIPLARRIGVGDDLARSYFIARMTRAERQAATAAVLGSDEALDVWIGSMVSSSLTPVMQCFYWLKVAVEEMVARDAATPR